MGKHKQRIVNKEKITDSLRAYKKVRKDWGDVVPITKIKQSDKLYNRSKTKAEFKKRINYEEQDD